jgi:hypothetical protein
MVTNTSLALAPNQVKFWRRIIEFCGDSDGLSLQELRSLGGEIYASRYATQIKITIDLFVANNFLEKVSDEDYIVAKESQYREVKGSLTRARSGNKMPAVVIISRDEMRNINNVGLFTTMCGRK